MPKNTKSSRPDLILSSLSLRNFATFENQTIPFENGLNCIVGETGAGKSLILDALHILLGQRADKSLIRKGSDLAIIEAEFSFSSSLVTTFFSDLGYPCEEDIVVIKRTLSTNGQARAYLNHQNCSLSILMKVAKEFIDLVGQFDNQKLLSPDHQLSLLDEFCGINDLVGKHKELWIQWQSAIEEFENLESQGHERHLREEFLEFQLEEIKNLNPSEEDEKELLQNKEETLKIQEGRDNLMSALELLSEGESNIVNNMRSAIAALSETNPINSKKLEEILPIVEDMAFELSKNMHEENLESNLEKILDRLDKYQRLKRKFGKETQDIVDSASKLQEELEEIRSVAKRIEAAKMLAEQKKEECKKIAKSLSAKRCVGAKKLSLNLTKQIQALKMEGASIEFKIVAHREHGQRGLDKPLVMAETNPGEGPGQLSKMASGGELSRVLLAMRRVLATHDSISIFLFDEIDAGIGGETAIHIGRTLKEVAERSQVVVITHLPQIAHFADHLLNVRKDTKSEKKKDRTISQIIPISREMASDHIKSMTPLPVQ